MSTSVPKPFTLTINVGDLMNYGGQQYSITAVAAGVDDGKGNISYAVTLSNGKVVTCSANDTALNSPGTEAASTGVQVWSQSSKA